MLICNQFVETCLKVPNLCISGSDLQAALSAVFQTDEVTAGA